MNPEQQAVEKAFKPLLDARGKRKLSIRITDLKDCLLYTSDAADE